MWTASAGKDCSTWQDRSNCWNDWEAYCVPRSLWKMRPSLGTRSSYACRNAAAISLVLATVDILWATTFRENRSRMTAMYAFQLVAGDVADPDLVRAFRREVLVENVFLWDRRRQPIMVFLRGRTHADQAHILHDGCDELLAHPLATLDENGADLVRTKYLVVFFIYLPDLLADLRLPLGVPRVVPFVSEDVVVERPPRDLQCVAERVDTELAVQRLQRCQLFFRRGRDGAIHALEDLDDGRLLLNIKMIYMDDGQHNKPHFHVMYAEYEASVGIDGELLAGSLPVKQLKLVQAWAAIHEDELYAAWNNAVRGIPFGKIAPLQ